MARAAETKRPAVTPKLSVIVDSLPAFIAYHTRKRMSGTILGGKIYADTPPGKEFLFGQGFVSLHLLFFFGRQMPKDPRRQIPGGFKRDHTHGFVGFGVQ